ncbi:Vacuolar amino acid transporter 1 [Candida viswanathii]|uniref:Vacuolar amino acid transporter 1 n=1 Tax=Candida viswanathii TaxID=5486 RepID=A0A367YLN4_9ASCO|nr:Vacuolar amino acid transporter 1 [Candida viswanathii]
MPSSRPEPIPANTNQQQQQRRRSFLDYGGANSFNNFASSYSRAQQYLGSSLIEQGGDYMDSLVANNGGAAVLSDQESQISRTSSTASPARYIEFSPIPQDETSELLPVASRTSKRHSFSVITGNSTVAQTVFNSINTLIGIGMLSLPYGFKLSGWLCGTFLITASAILTNTTAKYLGRIQMKHPHLKSYSDIAFEYGGKNFSYFVTFFFVIDLFGASMTLILLFSDCFKTFFGNVVMLKTIIVAILFGLSFLPLHVLSILSFLGILGTLGIIVTVFICGLINPESPGSLLSPSPTMSLLPGNLMNLLFSLGLYTNIWGLHPVLPEYFLDITKPSKYPRAMNVSFFVTFVLDFAIGSSGYIMFGNLVHDSIIKSILGNEERYPKWVSLIFGLLMGILPISKLPLITKPIITSYENILGITKTYVKYDYSTNKMVEYYGPWRIICRFVFMVVLLSFALMFTSFGKLVSFLGSAICYTVCLTLPFLFYLKLNREEIGEVKSWFIKAGIVGSITCAVLGSYASIVMKIE